MHLDMKGSYFLIDSVLYPTTGFDKNIDMTDTACRAEHVQPSGAPELIPTIGEDLSHPSMCLFFVLSL